MIDLNGPRQFRAALRGDLAFFYRKCFATVSPNDAYKHNWHIDAMAHALRGVVQGEPRNLIVTLPPRNGKSLLASVAFPAWLLGHNPMARVICASYAEKLAADFSNQTVRHDLGLVSQDFSGDNSQPAQEQ